jgi:hypothetical protein
MRWLVIVVIIYAAISMLRSARMPAALSDAGGAKAAPSLK